MDITGQYFCSFNIKGQPYNEEFKIILEASVSVYDKFGVLHTCLVSKLPSKQIVIKTLMKESLEKGLDLSDVVFDKQIDEYHKDPPCKAKSKYDENLSFQKRKKTDITEQKDFIVLNSLKVLQKMRLDCLWVHLPDNEERLNDPDPIDVSDSISDAPPVTVIHKKVISVKSTICNSQNIREHQNQNEQNLEVKMMPQANILSNVRSHEISQEQSVPGMDTSKLKSEPVSPVKTEINLIDPVTDHNIPVNATLVTAPTEKENIVPVGLVFNNQHEFVDLSLSKDTSIEKDEPLEKDIETSQGDLLALETANNSCPEKNLVDDLNSTTVENYTLNELLPEPDNIEVNEVVEDESIGNEPLIMFCADIRRNEIGAFVNLDKEGSEISHTEQEQTEIITNLNLGLNHTYKKKKAARNYKKKGRKVKHSQISVKQPQTLKKVHATKQNNDVADNLTEKTLNVTHEVSLLTDEITKSSNDSPKTEEAIDLPLKETAEYESESDDNSGRRKRRRCSRNIDYKNLLYGGSDNSDDFESEQPASESESDSISSEKSLEGASDMVAETERMEQEANDPDYDPSDLSGASDEEGNSDEESLSDIKVDEDGEEIIEKSCKGKKEREKTQVLRVNLEEHEDKFKIVKFVSTEQRNRGKAMEDKSHDSFACTICNTYQTADRDLISIHIGQHLQGKLRCKFCGIESSTTWQNLQHIRKEHPNTGKTVAVVCELCGIPVSGRYSRHRHMYKVHNIPSLECRFCLIQGADDEKKFATFKELREHAKSYHPNDIYQCSNCDRCFFDKTHLGMHKRTCKHKDKDNEVWQCSECQVIYESKGLLMQHIRRAHRKEKKCKCTMCDYVAYCISSVKRHMAHAHFGQKEYKCELCPFSAVQPGQLKSHMRTHTGVKPFKCDQCSYAAAWNVQLKDHMKVHELPNTVTCQKCGIVFKNQKTLKRHDTREHREKTETEDATPNEDKSANETSEK